MCLGRTTTQLDTIFAADAMGTVISNPSLTTCTNGAFDACRRTGHGYLWAAEGWKDGEHGGSSWGLRALSKKMAWLPLIFDRVTLDTNHLQGENARKEGTYYCKRNTFISNSISLAWFKGDHLETICTLDRGIDKVGVLMSSDGQHDRKGCGS